VMEVMAARGSLMVLKSRFTGRSFFVVGFTAFSLKYQENYVKKLKSISRINCDSLY